MYLIVGLGNPGKEYALTRHNVGFLFVDYLARTIGANLPPEFPLRRGTDEGVERRGFSSGGRKGGQDMGGGVTGVAGNAGGLGIWKKGYQGLYTQSVFAGEKIILLKPETYMNLSGKSVSACASFFKIPKEKIIVISDDVDMEFQKVRYRATGSAGGHNGLASIIECLGTNEFQRIKIGIGRHPNMATSDWVLSKFTKGELEKLEATYELVEKKLKELVV